MIKNSLILFDCFGVVLNGFLSTWLSRHFTKEKVEELFNYYAPKGDLGEISLFECAHDMIFKYGVKDYTEEDIINQWIEIAKPNKKLIKKINKLKKYNKIALVSNAWNGCVEMIFNHYKINFNLFDCCFISYKYKMKKPDLRFYQIVLDFFKEQKFERVYMIDDHMSSMIGVEKLNIRPIIFEDNSSIDFLFK